MNRFDDSLLVADYHKHSALGSSGINALLDCPASYDYFKRHPGEDPDTAATELGTSIHAYVLERDTFHSRYFVTPPGFTRAKKDDKAKAEAEEAAGRRQIKHDDMERVKAIREAVFACNDARALIEGCAAHERSAFWDRGDVACKARFDVDAVTHLGCLADLKSAANPSPIAFAKGDFALARAVQAEWYSDGYLHVTQDAKPRFLWIVCPTEAPYHGRVWVGEPDHDFLLLASARITKAVDLYRRCRDSGHFPGYAEGGIISISPPAWMIESSEIQDFPRAPQAGSPVRPKALVGQQAGVAAKE